MTPMESISHTEDGFTLIEIIVTIILGSIMATVLFQFMGTTLTKGSGPVEIVRDSADMEALMEDIIATYVKEINTNPATALQNLQSATYTYAADSRVTLTYIAFDASGSETTPALPPTDTLKVTVRSAGHSLTTLLTNSRVLTDDPVSKF